MIKKIIALSAVTFLASARRFNFFQRFHPEAPKVEEVSVPVESVATWPELVSYTTFKTDFTGNTWDGKKLVSYKDMSGTAKVDGDRNKIKVDATVKVPLIGHAKAEILVDFEHNVVLEYVPLLKIC